MRSATGSRANSDSMRRLIIEKKKLPKGSHARCPNGIDIDFENVGGETLDAVLARVNLNARIVLCGLISQYNATEPVPGPYNFMNVLTQRARVQGFIILDYAARFHEAAEKI